MNIFLLEDDIALHSSIKNFLKEHGFQVESHYDGERALEVINIQQYDLYLFDINVPGIDGLKLLELVRLQNRDAKVLIISASSDIETIQKAYELGSIDYLKKPFYVQELLYKINLLFQRDKKFDIPLLKEPTKKERALLELLYQNLEKLVTYERIEEKLYKENSMTQNALRGVVKRLRKKLKTYTIKSVMGVGYILEKKEL